MPRTNRKEVIGKAVRNLTSKGKGRVPADVKPMPLPIVGGGKKIKNIGPRSGKKFDVKGHPLPDIGRGTVNTEQARLVKKVKPKQLGRDKGQFRKVKGGFKRRRFTIEQRQDFRAWRNIPEWRPKPKKRKPKGPHGPTEGRPVVDPGSLT